MGLRDTFVERVLSASSIREISESARAIPRELSLPDAQKSTRHLLSLDPPHSLRLGVVHTYTSDLLDPWLKFHAAMQGIKLEIYHAPYGLDLMEAQPGSGLVEHQPELSLLLLRREDLHPDLSKPITGLSADDLETLRTAAVAFLGNIVNQFRTGIPGRLIVSLLPAMSAPTLGIYDTQSEHSEMLWWAKLKADIARLFRASLHATTLLDLDQMMSDIGRHAFFDARFWYSYRFPFTAIAASEFARRVTLIGSLDKYPKAKVIVLDADNTMWGGVIGEDGINGIALGPDYPGNAYVDFQRRILDYQQRGLLLAICSKNNPEDVDEVLNNHPHQVLRREHFAASRVNWLPKHENLASLAKELNLGLDSFVFVDDSDHECAIVRRELASVTVIQTPSRPVDVPGCLDSVARLEILSLTQEDLAKTGMYAQEQQRRQLQQNFDSDGGDITQYLASLQMKMQIEMDNTKHLSRLAQLTQKTNQFNLTTHRYNEQQLREFVVSDEWRTGYFSLADIFGDSGIVGLALIRRVSPEEAEIDTFLMSCRVIGRKAETAFLETLLSGLKRNGVKTVTATYRATAKNRLVQGFYPNHGFVEYDDGRFRRLLTDASPVTLAEVPIEVTIA